VEDHLRELAAESQSRLESGAAALDVVEFAVAELEASGMCVAGKGSAPNTAGYVELDASIMDGATREAGAVAAIVGVVNPVSVARRIMQETPHVMLGGKGALAFARSLNLETSTGGTFGKLEGRIGDSPLIGPGTWADDDVAISFTGTGEHIIRSGGAISIAHKVAAGAPVNQAIQEVLDEIKRLGGDAGVIVVTKNGEIAMPYNTDGMKRASVSSTSPLQATTFD
jgi:L-asparaginase/beta-aspartyl-peptidase (threonine type)